MDQQNSKVELFLKLGYSHRDIMRVLENLQHDAQTNDILEELIKTCQTTPATTSRSAHSSPRLVPRGCSSPQPSSVTPSDPCGGFRSVVIDGSNVAMSHGNKQVFSCRGLMLAVKWFLARGVRDITVFVPLWRKEQPRPEAPMTDQPILHELEKKKILVYTPSRCVNGKRVVCYDDRYIIKLAYESDGIIVSNDNYRDLQIERPEWKKFIEERLLMYSFVNDKFMPPDDPLGRNGPTIDTFLRKKVWTPENKQHCPYGKKCTYGVKCKFYHPERSNQSQLSVADELRAKNQLPAQADRPSGRGPALGPGVNQEAHVYTPYEPDHAAAHPYRYPSTPPPLRPEDHSHRSSPSELLTGHRETGSPSLHHMHSLCPSPDSDEAFGSMEASLSRLYIQDQVVSHTYSSGVPGCSADFYPSSPYGSRQRLSPEGAFLDDPERLARCGYERSQSCQCNQCIYNHQRPQPTSYNPHSNPGHFTEPQHFRSRCAKSHSLPDHICRPCMSGESTRRVRPRGGEAQDSEQRQSVKNQLSALFPPNIVDYVMNVYPHILNSSELVPLIQSVRTSHVPF
ncbi:hypothetical protein UPYG_G00251160 [Umbra pygmaea]|uniref:C3H1-type domain-containing protein n=1 Tax=Umbra pygmaea TaxID=75934 RepID=A0ABD0W7L4_UMBPY